LKDFYNILSQANDDVFDIAGVEDAVYSPPVGDDVTCSVLIENSMDFLPSGYHSGSIDQTKIIGVRPAELGVIPESGGVFTIDEVQWTITAPVAELSGERTLKFHVKKTS
jgi:hypothetical protein